LPEPVFHVPFHSPSQLVAKLQTSWIPSKSWSNSTQQIVIALGGWGPGIQKWIALRR
jgi:hypothetical protein